MLNSLELHHSGKSLSTFFARHVCLYVCLSVKTGRLYTSGRLAIPAWPDLCGHWPNLCGHCLTKLPSLQASVTQLGARCGPLLFTRRCILTSECLSRGPRAPQHVVSLCCKPICTGATLMLIESKCDAMMIHTPHIPALGQQEYNRLI